MNKLTKNLNRSGYLKLTALIANKSFSFFEKYFGVHLTPANYYSPIPLISERESGLFQKRYLTDGISWSDDAQLAYLREVFPKYSSEFTPKVNSGLSLVDAFILYSMIREKKPSKVVEVGAGDTTYITLLALNKNLQEGHPFFFSTIEPYPRADIAKLDQPCFSLINKKIQEVSLDFFKDVDFLFIDSSHVSKLGSDVNYEVLEILPILPIDSMIHFHDIPFPENYWEDWTDTGTMFWNESYLLHSFMLFNHSFKVQWASNYMRLNYMGELKKAFPFLTEKHRLSSFWIKRVL